MPIGPSQAIPLLEVYEDLIAGAEDLTSAAAKIAPAAVREVLCVAGNVAGTRARTTGPTIVPVPTPTSAPMPIPPPTSNKNNK